MNSRITLFAVILGTAVVAAPFVRAADAPAAPAKKAVTITKPMHLAGQVEAVDAKAGTVTIKHHDKTRTFTCDASTAITGQHDKAAHLSDIKVGDHVSILFADEGGKLVASKIVEVELKASK